MLLEKILASVLNIYTRQEYKHYRNRETRDINFKDSSDLAYVRATFKRYLFKNRNNIKGLLLIDIYNSVTRLDFNNSYNHSLDFTVLDDRNKVINSIDNWINSNTPAAIKFY